MTKLMRLKDVMNVTGLSRAYLYKLQAEGLFPQSVSLVGRAVAWVESEVEDWIEERIAQRDSGVRSSETN